MNTIFETPVLEAEATEAEVVVAERAQAIRELSDLELAFVGGGAIGISFD